MNSTFSVLSLTLGLTVLLVLNSACARVFLPVDAKIPLDLSKAGNSAEAEFQIWVEDDYVLELKCMTYVMGRDWDKDNDIEKYLLGGQFGKRGAGAILPLHLTWVRLSGKKEEKLYQVAGVRVGSSVSSKAIYGTIYHSHLKPGKYRLKITKLKDHPRLQYVPVEVVLRYDYR